MSSASRPRSNTTRTDSRGALRTIETVDPTPDILLLNGTSSAGKTSVAKALIDRLDDVWLHVTLNAIFDLMPAKFLADPAWIDRIDWGPFLTGFHLTVAQLPKTGYGVILDHVCAQRPWIRQCADVFSDYRVLHVGVTCPLDEFKRRERQRGDRKVGIAEEHLATHDQARPFDLEVDSQRNSPEEYADLILAVLREFKSPTAFERIRCGDRDRNSHATQ